MGYLIRHFSYNNQDSKGCPKFWPWPDQFELSHVKRPQNDSGWNNLNHLPAHPLFSQPLHSVLTTISTTISIALHHLFCQPSHLQFWQPLHQLFWQPPQPPFWPLTAIATTILTAITTTVFTATQPPCDSHHNHNFASNHNHHFDYQQPSQLMFC